MNRRIMLFFHRCVVRISLYASVVVRFGVAHDMKLRRFAELALVAQKQHSTGHEGLAFRNG